jgi:hypothetical protein
MKYEPKRGLRFKLRGGLRRREARPELNPQAWQFELSGEAARRGPSGSAVRRVLR